MSVTFSDAPSLPSTVCGICYEPLEEDVVGHDNMHFLHKKCIEAWAKHHNSCPFCRATFQHPDHPGLNSVGNFITKFGNAVGLKPLTTITTTLGGALGGLWADRYCLEIHQIDGMLNPIVLCTAGVVTGLAIGKLICGSGEVSDGRVLTATAISILAPITAVYTAINYL